MNKLFNSLRSLGILISLCAFAGNAVAQSASDLKVNEFLVNNVSNYQDDFGARSSWIEIFNTANSSVNIAGCYLTNDPKNPTKFRIPKGNSITQIPSRGYLVFWADNNTTQGILHLNFDLKSSNYLALYDQSGKVLIDSVSFNPAVQKADTSCARVFDADAKWALLAKPTPNANNNAAEQPSAGSTIQKSAPHGAALALFAIVVVCVILILLSVLFKYIGKANINRAKKATLMEFEKQGIPATSMDEGEISGEALAAIAMALQLFETEKVDLDSTILTIEKTSRTYSPWSSKIYSMSQVPHKK
ncbi:OadG family transporter subunit [uncultured Acetobacteroides sp.]|uniref:OadG family transporter subunit n=1 Tax=uncultured Acetobacteroides sp. TaxID=1760811 RepID=UPI0029F4B7FE|nr:OadG family transporter subunit [uncultured Acetobacteroides sp.]